MVYDGDLIALINEPLFIKGIDRDCSVVIDVEDKITAISESITKDNIIALIKRTIGSKIGEISNYATYYHNKQTNDEEQLKKYNDYIDLLSIINGKEIDKAKTGVSYPIPFSISKFARPLPYFMKYRSEYYSKLKLGKTQSNMNRLAWKIEKWEKKLRYKRTYRDFDFTIMMNYNIPKNEDIFDKVEDIYLQCCSELKEISEDAHKFKNYNQYKSWFDIMYPEISEEEIKNFTFNYNYYYNEYKEKALSVCPNVCELANYLVELCYVKYPNKNKKLLWKMAGNGIVKNISQVPIKLPVRVVKDDESSLEYLGKKYKVEDVVF